MRKVLFVCVVLLAGCGGGVARVDPPPLVRPADAKTDMDTNPANLASAVITAGLHQLPVYIDAGAFRLLPFDLQQASVPGKTLVARYRVTMPRTHAVVDTVAVASPTAPETREIASQFRVRATFDGTALDVKRHWVFYRNNGPQICRIYFPGDLGSLQMGANSFVLNPLRPGEHVLRVEVEQRVSASLPPARIVRVYRLHVLPRGVGAKERAIAPSDESTPPPNNVPLVLRQPEA
jgi:hypothetical protein